MERDRALWCGVLEQARDDLLFEAPNSLLHLDAVAFFLGGGEWVFARERVGEHIGISGDEIRRAGERMLTERCTREGRPLPVVARRTGAPPPRQPIRKPTKPQQPPRIVPKSVPKPPAITICDQPAVVGQIRVKQRNTALPARLNPFSAFYERLGLVWHPPSRKAAGG